MRWKILQITDTHLFETPDRELGGVNTCQTLGAVVADIASHHPVFDALLLTGDLSQDETAESYELLSRTLAPLRGAPVHAIPGNHDDPHHLRARLGEADIQVAGELALGNWRIVMLDSQVPGAVYGELGSRQLGRLGDSLAGEDRHVMLALHHPPLDIGCPWLDRSRCGDGEALLAVARQRSVKAMFCGHVHQTFEATRGGVRILTTPSTCVQFKPGMEDFAIDDAVGPGYRVLSLEENGDWSTRVRRVPA